MMWHYVDNGVGNEDDVNYMHIQSVIISVHEISNYNDECRMLGKRDKKIDA